MSRTFEELRVVHTRTRTPELEPWSATLRLALAISLVAAVVAVALSAVVAVPAEAMVLAVIVVGFGISWVRSARHVA